MRTILPPRLATALVLTAIFMTSIVGVTRAVEPVSTATAIKTTAVFVGKAVSLLDKRKDLLGQQVNDIWTSLTYVHKRLDNIETGILIALREIAAIDLTIREELRQFKARAVKGRATSITQLMRADRDGNHTETIRGKLNAFITDRNIFAEKPDRALGVPVMFMAMVVEREGRQMIGVDDGLRGVIDEFYEGYFRESLNPSHPNSVVSAIGDLKRKHADHIAVAEAALGPLPGPGKHRFQRACVVHEEVRYVNRSVGGRFLPDGTQVPMFNSEKVVTRHGTYRGFVDLAVSRIEGGEDTAVFSMEVTTHVEKTAYDPARDQGCSVADSRLDANRFAARYAGLIDAVRLASNEAEALVELRHYRFLALAALNALENGDRDIEELVGALASRDSTIYGTAIERARRDGRAVEIGALERRMTERRAETDAFLAQANARHAKIAAFNRRQAGRFDGISQLVKFAELGVAAYEVGEAYGFIDAKKTSASSSSSSAASVSRFDPLSATTAVAFVGSEMLPQSLDTLNAIAANMGGMQLPFDRLTLSELTVIAILENAAAMQQPQSDPQVTTNDGFWSRLFGRETQADETTVAATEMDDAVIVAHRAGALLQDFMAARLEDARRELTADEIEAFEALIRRRSQT